MKTKHNQYRSGDSFTGWRITFPFDLTGVTIEAKFKRDKNLTPVAFEFKEQDGTMVIPDRTNGQVFFMPRVMDFPPRDYHYTIKLFFPNGKEKVYVDNVMTLYT